MRVRELTPPGRGALSVVLVEGEGALEHVRQMLGLSKLMPGRIVLASLAAAGEELDQALLVAESEGQVELHVHGNPHIVATLLRALSPRTEPASPGEPSSNRELAARLLPDAPCEEGARILLDQIQDALARELRSVLGEEDEGGVRAALAGLAERSRVARHALRRAQVVLAGPVNAGKSTLFNALVGAERTVSSEEPGTTRDAIGEPATLGAYPVLLVDTAGLRPLEASVRAAALEQEAQEIARRCAERADLLLLLEPVDRPAEGALFEALRAPSVLRLWSCADRVPADRRPQPAVAALPDPEGARREVLEGFRACFHLPEHPWEPGRGVLLASDRLEELKRALAVGDGALRARAARLLAEETGVAGSAGGR